MAPHNFCGSTAATFTVLRRFGCGVAALSLFVANFFLLNVPPDVLIIGEFPGLEFRVHERAVDTDFETAAVGRNKHETLDSCLEVFDEFVGQTDRLGFVVSNLAIDDFDFHLFPL